MFQTHLQKQIVNRAGIDFFCHFSVPLGNSKKKLGKLFAKVRKGDDKATFND